MEDDLILHRETLTIEGGRNLYNYTFSEADDQDELVRLVRGGNLEALRHYLREHPEADRREALEVARAMGHGAAAQLLS
jgi:hypothetical protein